MNREEVILNVEGNHIRCSRKILISHSEYFKVMLEGKFVEGSKDVIPLYDVDSKAFNIILMTIYDNNNGIPDEDLLMVLQTAAMLQFDHIRDICVERVTTILSPTNCLNVWHVTELLGIKSLYLKAKYLALTRFEEIKEQDCLLELNIKQVYRYLSNTKLCCVDEYTIFDLAMKWYRTNMQQFDTGLQRVDILLYILSCVDFNRLSYGNIEEMRSHEYISEEKEIADLLDDILKLKKGNDDVPMFSKGRRFLKSKHRQNANQPCIVGYNYQNSPSTREISTAYCYDVEENTFKDIITIPDENYFKLQGYHMLGYKHFVYTLGGEFQLGRGNWNDKVWVFDTIRGGMEEKTNLPMKLRHFEACIAGDNLYIVGGTAALRVKSTSVHCYSLKNDTWTTISKLVMCSQNKCCDYNGNLLVINLNEKCGYLLENDDWILLKFEDNKKLVDSYPLQYAVFSYGDYVYIKGSSLIRLQQVGSKLVIVDCSVLKSVCCDKMDSVMCDENTVFTLYKQTMDEGKSISLELLDLQTLVTETILECIDDETGVEIGDRMYHFASSSKLFNIFHYTFTERDSYICDYYTS